MIVVMGFVRRSLIVVVMAVTALASALDGCLMDCHPQAPAAGPVAHAHCHPPALSSVEGAPPQQAGTPSTQRGARRWQADPTCHHDHAAAAAETAVRIRVDSRPLGVAASLQTLSVRPLVPISPVVRRSTSDRSAPAVPLVPLRV
jgi:hypothetical protein